MMFVSKAFGLLPNDSFCSLRDRVRCTQRGVGWKPDIHIRQVLGKELGLQHPEKYSAQNQNDERAGECTPTMSEREITYPVIERGEPMLPPLGHRRLQTLWSLD